MKNKTLILSKRLATIVNYILPGMKVADIGSDHAYLPCYAVTCHDVPFAIAGEVADGPYESALHRVNELKLTSKIDVRKGDGLDVLANGEVDCVTIAGMGGPLITSILEQGKEKLADVQRLILQPNVAAHAVRQWLLVNGWELIAEEIIEENEKIYEILVAEKGDPDKPYKEMLEMGLLLGPFLQKEQNDVFLKKWQGEMTSWKRVLVQLGQAQQSEEVADKLQSIKDKLAIVEEAIKK